MYEYTYFNCPVEPQDEGLLDGQPCRELTGADFPLFAFSHCRDVVVEVTRAGGFGVLGGSGFTPESLEQELTWIDEHVNGRPYGIDILIPEHQANVTRSSPQARGTPSEARHAPASPAASCIPRGTTPGMARTALGACRCR